MVLCFLKALKKLPWADRKEENHPEKSDIYCAWALQLLKKEVGMQKTDNPPYGFPKELLEFIRTLIPGEMTLKIFNERILWCIETW